MALISTADAVRADLARLTNPTLAKLLQRFFKTGPGDYGEGDVFLGIKVPATRKIARAHRDLPLPEVSLLLKSPAHEARLAALAILVLKFAKADEPERQRIYDLYLHHTRFINNWDLVDISAPQIVGGHLADKNRGILFTLAKSDLLWDRRIAMLATFYFIRFRDEYEPTLQIAALLLNDHHDLIHKAVGWMLREVGKRNLPAETAFLDQHAPHMPRTMLRYAIERFPADQRQHYLAAGPTRASTGNRKSAPVPNSRCGGQ